MGNFGLQDIANAAGGLLDGRRPDRMGGSGVQGLGGADGGFDQLFKHAADNRATGSAAEPGSSGAAGAGQRRGMADPEQWAASHGAPAGNPGARSAAAEQLSDYLSMPLGKRMFYMMLASMGISQEQYDAMSPEEQAKVAAQVAQRLKDSAESQKQASRDKDAETAGV
ncbi:hypothetical protein BOSP111201_03715 [Bordetella sputigena]|uniref:hypothetical protein n=1 Tax=Bordetella sputigena TaxID=1416810 RepID=UPI0039F0BE0B